MSFTPEQHSALLELPKVVLAGIISADGSGFFNTVREFSSASDFFNREQDKYHDNLLVLEVIDHFLNTMRDANDVMEAKLTEEEIFYYVQGAVEVLGSSPDAPGYKNFIYELAYTVANAAGTQMFGRGDKIDEAETNFLNTLQQYLSV